MFEFLDKAAIVVCAIAVVVVVVIATLVVGGFVLLMLAITFDPIFHFLSPDRSVWWPVSLFFGFCLVFFAAVGYTALRQNRAKIRQQIEELRLKVNQLTNNG